MTTIPAERENTAGEQVLWTLWFAAYGVLMFIRWPWVPLFWNCDHCGNWPEYSQPHRQAFLVMCIIAASMQVVMITALVRFSGTVLIAPEVGCGLVYVVMTVFRMDLWSKYNDNF